LNAGGRFFANGTEYPSTPQGDLMFTQFASFAEYEKATIRERTVGGRERKAKSGEQPYRVFSPYGFHVVNKADVQRGDYPKNALGKYYVMPEQARWAREMAERYAAGMSLPKIQNWLFTEGVKTAQGLDKWSFSSIRRTISHPAMVGRPAVGRTKYVTDETRKLRGMKRNGFSIPRPENEWITLSCEPLISEEVYAKCLRRFGENRAKKGGNPKRRYKLGGLIACPVCGKIVGGSKQGNGRYYRCPHDRGCNWRWNSGQAEADAERGVRAAARNTGLSEMAIQSYKARHRAPVQTDRKAELEKLIADLNKQERVLVDAQLDAMMKGRSTDVYEAKLDDINTRRAALNSELKSLQATRAVAVNAPLTSSDMIASVLRDVDEALSSPHLTDVEKNAILSEVVAKIEPTQDCTEATITLRSFF
jgi:DNA invertase Pin-like site-specific DNA recombinase